MEHPAEKVLTESGAEVEPWYLSDYYAILGVDSGFSHIHLLRQFLRRCKQTMPTGDQEEVMAIRKGFEVLRYEDTRIAYYRMHRVLVRREPLRFPEAKKREMLHDIRTKEASAMSGTKPVIKPGMTYARLLDDVQFGIIWLDLAHVIPFGASGVFLLLAIPFLIAISGVIWLIVGVSVMLAAVAIFHLRERIKDYVTDPEMGRG